MNDRVRIETTGHVAVVSLARAGKRNAVDMPMFHAIVDAARDLRGRKGVRAIVLTGDGPDFCAGIDVSVFQGAGLSSDGPDLTQPVGDGTANIVQQVALAWRELPMPVIAAVRGAAFGAGLQIAMGADLRLASPDARLALMEIRWGLIPDMGLTATFRHVVRLDVVRELAYTGRIVDAREAQQLGLVSRVCDDPLQAARDLAAEIAGRSPDAIRHAKALINVAWDIEQAAALRLEAESQLSVLAGRNQQEAARAVIEQREPAFEDPD